MFLSKFPYTSWAWDSELRGYLLRETLVAVDYLQPQNPELGSARAMKSSITGKAPIPFGRPPQIKYSQGVCAALEHLHLKFSENPVESVNTKTLKETSQQSLPSASKTHNMISAPQVEHWMNPLL